MLLFNALTHSLQTMLFSAFSALAPPAGEPPADLQTGDQEALLDTYGYCSASSELSPTGRQNALIKVSPREPDVCVRIKLGGIAGPGVPDCWKIAHELGCDVVVDLN